MILIKLTKNKEALIDNDDYELLSKYKWFAVNKGGKTDLFYAACRKYYKQITMHRMILNITDKNIIIDHIDGNGLNNQKSNLRVCKLSDNLKNRNKPSNNKTGYKGVSYKKQCNKYYASIGHKNKNIYLGHFNNPIDAAKAYNEMALLLFGDYAKLNNI